MRTLAALGLVTILGGNAYAQEDVKVTEWQTEQYAVIELTRKNPEKPEAIDRQLRLYSAADVLLGIESLRVIDELDDGKFEFVYLKLRDPTDEDREAFKAGKKLSSPLTCHSGLPIKKEQELYTAPCTAADLERATKMYEQALAERVKQ